MMYTLKMKSFSDTRPKKNIKVAPVKKDIAAKIPLKNHVKKARPSFTKKIVSPYLKKCKRYTKQGAKALLLSPLFHTSFKVLTGVLISTSLLYGSYLYISKTFANEVIISQSEIVARVAKLMSLPKEQPLEIVRVQDENDLRKQNSFYKDIKEGDYILVYKNVAVIYDLRNNVVVAVKRTEAN